MAVTSQLCERIAGTDYKNLGEPAIEAARRLVLDGIAIAIAGTEEEAIHILAAHHREQGGAGHATAIGNGFRLNTVSASVLNGAAMHVLDFEPMWSPANHALSTTLAGVLALAEAQGATGREVLTALIKGVEMQGWIRQASGQFEASTTRFHPPGAAGPLGAAVAAGHILKLDPDQLANAGFVQFAFVDLDPLGLPLALAGLHHVPPLARARVEQERYSRQQTLAICERHLDDEAGVLRHLVEDRGSLTQSLERPRVLGVEGHPARLSRQEPHAQHADGPSEHAPCCRC